MQKKSSRKVTGMKFKTRLVVTFLAIILLPIILAGIAYFIIGAVLVYNIRNNYGVNSVGISLSYDPVATYTNATDDYYETIKEMAEKQPEELEDTDHLQEFDNYLHDVSSFLLVRKGDDIYFKSDEQLSLLLFERLPKYGQAEGQEEAGYYFNDLQCLVKQIDFQFSDQTPGSIFVVTRVNLMVSENLVTNMFVAMIMVLILTSILATSWIRQSIFRPISELKEAMQKISEGNLEEPVVTDEGGEIGVLYHDFDQMRLRLKESADEKKTNELMNREMISNISHDLKTPITSIKGYVEGIMDGVADSPEKIEKYIKTIYNKANDMDRLINELTLYSQIDANRIPYNFHNIGVCDYFNDCVEEVGLDLESGGIQFTYENKVADDVVIIADPEQLKRVINNIIHNSVKYQDKAKGQIKIQLTNEKEFVHVVIEDNGKGIPEKDLDKIFERFYRTDASRNSSQGGSGIGLSVAKKIIEDHGGTIWATCKETPGVCIHFTLRKVITETADSEDLNESTISKIETIIKNTAKGLITEAEKKVNTDWRKQKDKEKGEVSENEKDNHN